jgi:Na+/melibiose symporter-like transporter
LTHGKKDQAIAALTKLRKKEASDSGAVAAEIEAIYQAVEFDKETANTRWRDILPKRGYNSYFRRAVYSALLFWFYQSTGNSFYNAYGPTFFVNVGLGSKSFTYATIVQLVGAIGSFTAVFLTDRIGRRPLILTGGVLLIVFNALIAGFGVGDDRTDAKNNIVIASFILMIWSTKISWATHCCTSLLEPHESD